jgi:hypothetical protein
MARKKSTSASGDSSKKNNGASVGYEAEQRQMAEAYAAVWPRRSVIFSNLLVSPGTQNFSDAKEPT